MPRRKQVLPEGISGVADPVYGILYSTKDYTGWLTDNAGRIIQSDFLGLMKAQLKILETDGRGWSGKIAIMGSNGEPIEMEN